MFRIAEFPGYRQLDQMDCGPTCLKMITEFFGRDFHLDYLRKISGLQKSGASFAGLSTALEELGIDSIGVKAEMEELINEVPLPAIAHWNSNHFVVVYKTNRKYIFISDPAVGRVKYKHSEFREKWAGGSAKGVLLLVEPTEHYLEQESPEMKSKSSFQFLIDYLLPYRKYLNQVLIGLFLATVIQLILPFLTQSLVDYGINFQNIGFIHLIVIAQLFLFLSRSATEVIRDWLLLYISTRVNIEMISDFLDKLLKLPISYFDSKTTGDFLQRIYDHQRVDEFLSGRALTIPFDIFYIIVFAVVLYFFDPTITFIFILGTGLFLGWSLLFMKKKEFLDHQLFELNRKDQSLFLQILLAVTEIKLNNSEARRKQEWKNNQFSLFGIHTRILKVDQAQINGGRFLNELTSILIVFWSAKAVIAGEITLGTMLAIQFIIGSLSLPVSNTIDFLVGYQRAMLSLVRLSEVHNQTLENSKEKKETKIKSDDIELKKVSFRYGEPSTPLILKELDIIIPQGKTTAIVGASGSGKTTLLKLLARIYNPTEGKIMVGNVNLEEVHSNSWRRKCGIVLQDGILFHDTIERNITESNSNDPTDRDLMKKAVELSNLDEMIDKLPLGYQTKVGEQGQLLSGGEKQRLLIARALYKNPDYLFFDEATSSLDSQNEKAITENLSSFYRNKTVVVIAHRLSTVKHADQILVMNDGKIVEKGNHQELISLQGFYYDLIVNQLGA
ncbi:peptidase domain-containing ABC transporter [Antarcticibacterium flavum]|uniref:Peptidase domain-containing ABC transporter n=1 Tax=Antarcticibacterium flavum TaxID=2058175 RepID=A0A5B7X6I0_9FLAO|nr:MULTISPECIES: peptidase domain-containing ABC transporter [Antarcticibacterium]MCM4161490.1 ABC transporter ATP-binding protein [Antarcticibacterium sp. W02-3]QCY71076.1 peptidase domain-containing ABC transporter [Antarcticibacterium flavum]